ncbi:MAG: HAMP domain-containing histidine kinase [Clostridia bacterium]|nr:HAMP domain-containing histidine kinase [Clostridia bacterium]
MKMIKTAQKRFILITLSIVFTVLSVIFLVMWQITGENLSREINISLINAENEYNVGSSPRLGKYVAVIKVEYYDTATGACSYELTSDERFSEETVKKVIAAAFSCGADRGNAGDVFFKTQSRGAETIIFAVDMHEKITGFHSALIKTLILLLTVFVALAVIVFILSAKVFEPIKLILAKQKQFISDASHELKTPVSIISASADVIRTEDNAVYADSIKQQVERLKFLINDLLTLARLDEGNIKSVKETFDLSENVIKTALPFDAVAFENGKSLDCDIEKNVIYEGDANSVRQILNILLDNAVKYAADGGKILVSLKKTGGKIALSVYNDGSLIREKDSAKIFERFFRGDDSRSRESGGNGLGLSIAKSIAAANKWTIIAQSVYDVSMTVTLYL